MRRFSLYALILSLGLSLALGANDAEARRLGGGMSSGMKRGSSITQRQATPPSAPAAPAQGMNQAARPAPAATPATAQPSGMRRWLGPLAGLAAGIGLAALFSHLGMGAEMGSFFMILLAGVAIFLVVRLLMRRSTPALQAAGASSGYAPEQRFEPVAAATPLTSSPSADANPHIPAGFDSEAFLRQAKLNFIRLQAANDAGNMEDIRAFTAPELYAEIQMQYQERGKAAQHTDVMQLEAALLDVTDEAARQIASVRFFGQIRETEQGAAENFSEVWHLTRPLDGSQGWMIAGIEQLS